MGAYTTMASDVKVAHFQASAGAASRGCFGTYGHDGEAFE